MGINLYDIFGEGNASGRSSMGTFAGFKVRTLESMLGYRINISHPNDHDERSVK